MRLLFLFVLAAVFVVGIGAYLGPDSLARCEPQPSSKESCGPADAIVAISGGDTSARTQAAIELYRDGWAPKLVFSGAAWDDAGPSNAAAMRNTAVEAGVPISDIVIEEKGRTTRQNAENVRALLGDSVSSIIVVTSPYHQRRADLEFERYFNGVDIRSHPLSEDRQWSSSWWWTSPGGWYLTIGELAKITVLYLGGLRG